MVVANVMELSTLDEMHSYAKFQLPSCPLNALRSHYDPTIPGLEKPKHDDVYRKHFKSNHPSQQNF